MIGQINSATEAKSIFLQVACALAVAETALEFEHRDLHWGNILVAPAEKRYIHCRLPQGRFILDTNGVFVSVIDYTLSRLRKDAPLRRKHHPHCRPRIPGTNRGFPNLHGARKPRKWEELYRTIIAEDISLFPVAETHLQDLEEPPTPLDWQWAGNNRSVGDRKGEVWVCYGEAVRHGHGYQGTAKNTSGSPVKS
ncbi:hypothetical protein HPB51_010128 [Rhipicephalus microplus]|uniref:Protein kinase domain-containing protein n=1 Tax=Rhipicephalus microplus TaxID=6941 RepID=A0A9J6F1L1_RHIMP|nr:hypothetical protein HPB51_010128 [Rhipicephalus microplus]